MKGFCAVFQKVRMTEVVNTDWISTLDLILGKIPISNTSSSIDRQTANLFSCDDICSVFYSTWNRWFVTPLRNSNTSTFSKTSRVKNLHNLRWHNIVLFKGYPFFHSFARQELLSLGEQYSRWIPTVTHTSLGKGLRVQTDLGKLKANRHDTKTFSLVSSHKGVSLVSLLWKRLSLTIFVELSSWCLLLYALYLFHQALPQQPWKLWTCT